MQRTDVTRPRELLHAPTLQEMLEMDSEIDGGRCPCRDGAVQCCAVLPADSEERGGGRVGHCREQRAVFHIIQKRTSV
jgi:hypothetical protein